MSLINKIQLVGHVCHDLVSEEIILGGTVSYAVLIARYLSNEISLLTSFGADFRFKEQMDQLGVTVENIPASQTTVFENVYEGDQRIQYLHQRAKDIIVDSRHIINDATLIMLCPIADEIILDNEFLAHYKGIKGATIQGWLRAVGSDKRVYPKLPDHLLFTELDIVVLSEDDISGFPDILDQLIKWVPIVVLTKGVHGADIYERGFVHHYPSYDTKVVDLTGAGDIFSVVFMSCYAGTKDIKEAAVLAHSAASLSIEGKGTEAIPDLEKIKNRYNLYVNKYL